MSNIRRYKTAERAKLASFDLMIDQLQAADALVRRLRRDLHSSYSKSCKVCTAIAVYEKSRGLK